ncbi:hypothetical protein SteCoe_19748 [Stentor coeruleus]|uniref:Transmembrane protein n=1 Tax=Stentor coeruleus TaxID=5963 RepID=A0A1R2BTL7_9CILI|nr:hypothetical protein SteCoe_19748 [Stentor coeruleus]
MEKKPIELKDLPSKSYLRQQLFEKYQKMRVENESEADFSRKVQRRKRDFKEFMKNSSSQNLEDEDRALLGQASSKMLFAGTCLVLPGSILSIYIGKYLGDKFITKPLLYRLSIRYGVIFIPLLCTYTYTYNLNEKMTAYIEYKYTDRIQEYLKTKDIKAINPNYNKEN